MCGTFCGARDDEAEVRGIFVAGETIRWELVGVRGIFVVCYWLFEN